MTYTSTSSTYINDFNLEIYYIIRPYAHRFPHSLVALLCARPPEASWLSLASMVQLLNPEALLMSAPPVGTIFCMNCILTSSAFLFLFRKRLKTILFVRALGLERL